MRFLNLLLDLFHRSSVFFQDGSCLFADLPWWANVVVAFEPKDF